MKEWKDIPEFKKLWDEAMAEYEYLKTLEYDKKYNRQKLVAIDGVKI